MRALTVRQPWEFAIEHSDKVENRSWHTSYRGPLWLHAGARSRWDPAALASHLVWQVWYAFLRSQPDRTALPSSGLLLTRQTTLMPFGAVSALATLEDIHHSDECGNACSEWSASGQWHWVLQDVRPLAAPVPCKGALGLWRPPEDVEAAVRAQLAGRRQPVADDSATPLVTPPPLTPECEPHEPWPGGYIASSEYADLMMESHVQRRCRGCGHWMIWEPKL